MSERAAPEWAAELLAAIRGSCLHGRRSRKACSSCAVKRIAAAFDAQVGKRFAALDRKYSRDGGSSQSRTLGEIVADLMAAHGDRERFLDVLDAEFIAGCWKHVIEDLKGADRLYFPKDIRGLVLAVADAASAQAGKLREAQSETPIRGFDGQRHPQDCTPETCACFEAGLGSCLMHRCRKHYAIQQINREESRGSECGGCIVDALKEDRDVGIERMLDAEDRAEAAESHLRQAEERAAKAETAAAHAQSCAGAAEQQRDETSAQLQARAARLEEALRPERLEVSGLVMWICPLCRATVACEGVNQGSYHHSEGCKAEVVLAPPAPRQE